MPFVAPILIKEGAHLCGEVVRLLDVWRMTSGSDGSETSVGKHLGQCLRDSKASYTIMFAANDERGLPNIFQPGTGIRFRNRFGNSDITFGPGPAHMARNLCDDLRRRSRGGDLGGACITAIRQIRRQLAAKVQPSLALFRANMRPSERRIGQDQ